MSEQADPPRVERQPSSGPGVSTIWRLRSLEAARQLLRARHATRQAGFTAEAVPQDRLKLHPILMSDGPRHDEQRRKLSRFLAPAVVERRHLDLMRASATRLLDQAGSVCQLEDVALLYTVEVTAEVVGLTASPVPAMAKRLVSFFNQPAFDITREDLGRTPRQWATAARRAAWPIIRFHLADVLPAIRAHRRTKQDDIIGHLLDEGHSAIDILVECVTYGTAGMVTTREFIAMATWLMLEDEALQARYRAAELAERQQIVAELIRLHPVVAHLYRRATEPIILRDGDHDHQIEPGDLVDVCVREANTDPEALDDSDALCPGRSMPAGVHPTGLTFSDGAHRCPGQALALLESEIFLTELFARAPELVSTPTVGHDQLTEGYLVRGLEVRLGSR